MNEPLDPPDYIADEDPETPTTRRQAKRIEELLHKLETLKHLLRASNRNNRYLMTAIRSLYTDDKMNQIETLQSQIEEILQ